MSWSFGGKSKDGAFETDVSRIFRRNRELVAGTPAAVRTLRAIEDLVCRAPMNIPAGCTVAFETSGSMNQLGRGELLVRVRITDTPPEPKPSDV